MDNGIDYQWTGEMFICITHGAVFPKMRKKHALVESKPSICFIVH